MRFCVSPTAEGSQLLGNSGVSDGARTRDISDHNRVLYQLSYAHHVEEILPVNYFCLLRLLEPELPLAVRRQ